MENLFFDKKDLKYCGNNVIIGKTVRIRKPQECIIGDNVIIDDFTYISCSMEIGPYVHICSNCTFLGGPGHVKMGAFSGTSAGCRIVAASADFVGDKLNKATIPSEYADPPIIEPVIFEEFAMLGVNCVVLPGVVLKQGIMGGAMSLFTKKKYKSWMLYRGNPAEPVIRRGRKNIMEKGRKLLEENNIQYRWSEEE